MKLHQLMIKAFPFNYVCLQKKWCYFCWLIFCSLFFNF